MTYKTKVTFFVDYERIPDTNGESTENRAEWLGHLYSILREIVARLDGTFDCFHLDNVNSDKIEIEFDDQSNLRHFMERVAYSYLEDVAGDPMELRKREAKSKKAEAGD